MLICSFLDLGNGEMNEVLESGWQHLTSCHNLILRYENISMREHSPSVQISCALFLLIFYHLLNGKAQFHFHKFHSKI